MEYILIIIITTITVTGTFVSFHRQIGKDNIKEYLMYLLWSVGGFVIIFNLIV